MYKITGKHYRCVLNLFTSILYQPFIGLNMVGHIHNLTRYDNDVENYIA